MATDRPDRVDTGDTADASADGEENGGWPVSRRGLLTSVPTALTGALAGCPDVLDSGGDPGISDSETPTYGYGGTPTQTAAQPPTQTSTPGEASGGGQTATQTSTPTATRTSTPTQTQTRTATPIQTQTRTATPTSTSDPADEYGQQNYGEYGYGGVAP